MEKISTDTGKLFKVITLTLAALFTLIACQRNENVSMDNDLAEKVIQAIFDHADIQQYLHPNEDNRIPVRVFTSGLVSTDVQVNKFDSPVLFSNQPQKAPHFEIVTFNTVGNTVEFSIIYDVEGVSIDGHAVIEEGKVNLTTFDVIES